MKQLLQSPSDGAATVTDVPAPAVQTGCVRVRNAASLVSAGTERTAVEFAKKSLLAKARSRPDLVRKVLEKARTDGPVSALTQARGPIRTFVLTRRAPILRWRSDSFEGGCHIHLYMAP